MGLRENQDHRESLQTHKQRWKEVTKAIQSFAKCKCCTESKEWQVRYRWHTEIYYGNCRDWPLDKRLSRRVLNIPKWRKDQEAKRYRR